MVRCRYGSDEVTVTTRGYCLLISCERHSLKIKYVKFNKTAYAVPGFLRVLPLIDLGVKHLFTSLSQRDPYVTVHPYDIYDELGCNEQPDGCLSKGQATSSGEKLSAAF